MNESNVLVADDLDLVDGPKSAEVVSERLLGRLLLEVSNVDVPRRLVLVDRERDRLQHRRGLAPSDLELLAVQGELLDGRVGVEGGGGGAVEERDEHAGFLGQEADVLDGTEPDEVEELVDGRV